MTNMMEETTKKYSSTIKIPFPLIFQNLDTLTYYLKLIKTDVLVQEKVMLVCIQIRYLEVI